MNIWVKMWVKLIKSGSKTLDDVPFEYYEIVRDELNKDEQGGWKAHTE